MFKLHTKTTIKSDTLSLQPSDKGESAAWLVHKRPSSIDRAADMDYSMQFFLVYKLQCRVYFILRTGKDRYINIIVREHNLLI